MRNCSCCNKCISGSMYEIHLSMLDDIPLGNKLSIFFCSDCNFYFSDSSNNQIDYDNYYKLFNNYKNYALYSDKDQRCHLYLREELKDKNVNTILDYGSGNGKLKELLSNNFHVNEYDIGMNEDTNEYDCLILSHVLEHIYDINNFLQKIDKNIKPGGLLYIEVPNAEFYDKLNDITPLQEINIEHINFFSKYSLNKLLINHGYYAVSLKDDYFKIKENNYYVIRGMFIKCQINKALPSYVNCGNEIINTFNYSKLNDYEEIYIYGCGQFLFKILKNIQQFTKVINIIDDNLCYFNKTINGVSIINFEKYRKKTKKGDIILLTTFIYDEIIKTKIKSIDNIDVNVISMNEL